MRCPFYVENHNVWIAPTDAETGPGPGWCLRSRAACVVNRIATLDIKVFEIFLPVFSSALLLSPLINVGFDAGPGNVDVLTQLN